MVAALGALIGVSLLLSACTATPTIAAPASPTPAPTAHLTATPPPTESSQPEPSPSPDTRTLIFSDDFAGDTGWELGTDFSGTASLLNERLVLVARRTNPVLLSMSPAPLTGDGTFEVTVRSEICNPQDEFGLLVRALPREVHYRFLIRCDGSVRASRFAGDGEKALLPITSSFAVVPGAPALNRLTVRAEGDTFTFLVNGVEVYQGRDAGLVQGGSGVIVRPRLGGQTTIAFDDFRIWE